MDLSEKYPELAREYHHPDAAPGWNADKHLCKTCMWRNRIGTWASAMSCGACDYCGVAGHIRGCRWEDCDKYRKQKKGEKFRHPNSLIGKAIKCRT